MEKSYNKRYRASLMENSEFVRQFGLEKFMEMQKEKYTCPNVAVLFLFTTGNVVSARKK